MHIDKDAQLTKSEASWWLAAVSIINLTSSMLADGSWIELKMTNNGSNTIILKDGFSRF